MNSKLSAGIIIKKYIAVRGKSRKEIATELGIPYTTFNGRLNRDSIDVDLLFRLANLLDIDLNWMAKILDRKRPANPLAPLNIPRMLPEFREHDLPQMQAAIKRAIWNNPTSISDTRNELLNEYNLYYLLDILLPDNYNLFITIERGKEKYHCLSSEITNTRLRSPLISFTSGLEMLDQLIAERK